MLNEAEQRFAASLEGQNAVAKAKRDFELMHRGEYAPKWTPEREADAVRAALAKRDRRTTIAATAETQARAVAAAARVVKREMSAARKEGLARG